MRKGNGGLGRPWGDWPAAFLTLAAASGVLIGRNDRRSADPLAAAEMQPTVEQSDLSRETRRLLAELWKMEELDHPRRP